MKVVVIGGTGLIGSQVVSMLKERGVEAIAASPHTGVNALTGAGLPEALHGATALIDVSNSPTMEESAVRTFFEGSTRNLLATERLKGVTHHVLLSILGAASAPGNAYYRAKLLQEELVKAGSVPFTILHAAQFFEFVPALVQAGARADSVHASPALMQPVASREVAAELVRIALAPPTNGVLEIAGPQLFRIDELVRLNLDASGDGRVVLEDPDLKYFGAPFGARALVPSEQARLGVQRYQDFLRARAA